MSADTIRVAFNPADLPEWAQRFSAVVWLCRRDLAFRADVGRAETEQYRRSLIDHADRRQQRLAP